MQLRKESLKKKEKKPEKNQACRDSNPDLCDTGIAERCTGIAEVRVRIPASLIFFFQAFFSQLHKLL